MNKAESKYFNTARLMHQALIEILETKEFECVSVKEICQKAGVNRSTFYLHYETISDLLNETLEYINNEFFTSFGANKDFSSKIKTASLDELVLVGDSFLEPYLKFTYKNQSILKASFNNPKRFNVEKIFLAFRTYTLEPIMERFKVPQKIQNYWICYYVSGLIAIIQEWINNGCKESIEEIKNIIICCVRPDNGLLNKNER